MGKKTKRNLYKTNTSSDLDYAKGIKLAIIIALILIVVYFLTALAMGEIKLGKKEEEEKPVTSIQYEEIIAGQIFNRSDEEYYVMLFNFTDEFATYYLTLRDSYLKKDSHLPMYILDLEKKMNEEIIIQGEENYIEQPTWVEDLKVNGPTLLRIKNHKVVSRITNRENILKFFEENN